MTLAHVARPLAALHHVDRAHWQSVIACDPRARRHLKGVDAEFTPLRSIDPARFLAALRRGAPVYDLDTLRGYVAADLAVLHETRPDLVVGDFRLSLAVSARVAGIPYATLASACWSPQYEPPSWPVPALALMRWLPVPVAGTLFRKARAHAFTRHAEPMNRLRREFGLPAIDGDVRAVYTDADHVLYTDVPELFPLQPLPANARFVGPALWEPPTAAAWSWPRTSEPIPRVYVTLGSSGEAALLPSMIRVLGAMRVSVLVSTAARGDGLPTFPNVHVAELLPGVAVSASASLVVCNGGTLSCYQALSAGVPIVAIASNLEQFLTAEAIERAGAGVCLRADRFDPRRFREIVAGALEDRSLRENARKISGWCRSCSLERTIPAFLQQAIDRA
ncbi:MAG TPA: nucleotide disphospho-sugar-binding domain-containing protein [Casimicrobiaceae bacterium]